MSQSKSLELVKTLQEPRAIPVKFAAVLKKLKPVVYYTEQLAPVVVGQRAQVTAYEHYRLGRVAAVGEYLNTSMVVAVGEDGTTFETLNTMYVLRDEVDVD
jgi:hypothetical protein